MTPVKNCQIRNPWWTVCLIVLTAVPCAVARTPTLTAAQAARHIGEKATVCGVVASAHYDAHTRRQPTYIDLDKPYPHDIFTIVIWHDYRGRFAQPPETWRGRMCATGIISSFHGEPEMIVIGPAQIHR